MCVTLPAPARLAIWRSRARAIYPFGTAAPEPFINLTQPAPGPKSAYWDRQVRMFTPGPTVRCNHLMCCVRVCVYVCVLV